MGYQGGGGEGGGLAISWHLSQMKGLKFMYEELSESWVGRHEGVSRFLPNTAGRFWGERKENVFIFLES